MTCVYVENECRLVFSRPVSVSRFVRVGATVYLDPTLSVRVNNWVPLRKIPLKGIVWMDPRTYLSFISKVGKFL